MESVIHTFGAVDYPAPAKYDPKAKAAIRRMHRKGLTVKRIEFHLRFASIPVSADRLFWSHAEIERIIQGN